MIDILFEDEGKVFCVKPSGIDSEGQMVFLLKNQLGCEIYPLHRLDKPVSGVMIYAKTKKTAAEISKKISSGSDFKKEYLVICEGELENSEGIMEDLLFRDSSKNKSFVVKRERKGVKKAILSYKVSATERHEGKILSLVSVALETGRSHQIRVQFASRKHPLTGDRKYGSKNEIPIGLFSHRLKTCGLDISAKPPRELPWIIFDEEVNKSI